MRSRDSVVIVASTLGDARRYMEAQQTELEDCWLMLMSSAQDVDLLRGQQFHLSVLVEDVAVPDEMMRILESATRLGSDPKIVRRKFEEAP